MSILKCKGNESRNYFIFKIHLLCRNLNDYHILFETIFVIMHKILIN